MTTSFIDPSSPEPSDADIEAHITGLDVVADVPGPFAGQNPRATFNWTSGQPSDISIHALPPESQQAIRDKLVGQSPNTAEAAEREMVAAEVRRLARDHRVKTGLGEGAYQYHREMMEVENEERLLRQEAEGIAAQLQEVDGYSADVDETGQPLAIPIPTIKGDQRTALQNRYNQLSYKLSQLTREAPKRLNEALGIDKARIRQQREALVINAEATALAHEKAREERVEQLAAGKMKSLRSNLGG